MGISTTHLGGIGFHFIKEAGVFPPGSSRREGRDGEERKGVLPFLQAAQPLDPIQVFFLVALGPPK